MYKFGFIGMGNMGYAILKGLMSKYDRSEFAFCELSQERIDFVSSETNIDVIDCMKELSSKSKYIILAVKPQNYSQTLLNIKSSINEGSIIVSIAPGISIENIKNFLGNEVKVVRTMPNTPALVSEGMTVLSFSEDKFEDNETEEVKSIFTSCGEIEIVPETYMDAAVPISGSSPAYVYIMIEAMADAGVATGLPRNLAYKLAAQSVLGSAKMVLETGLHPGTLKDAVCSPAGTTIEAVSVLEKEGFRSSIIEAMKAAYKKTTEME